jgi:probable HAF family extracellular repeat protein
MTDLGTVQGDQCSNATSINEERQIVGNSSDCVVARHAFLWENGGPIVDLNSPIPSNSSLRLTNAENINERGEIAGVGVPAGCQPAAVDLCGHAFLLIPDGDCDSDCEGRIAASQNNVATAQFSATMKQGSETLVGPLERFRNQMRQRYQLSGQPAAPRD